jgi:hypothetical protein
MPERVSVTVHDTTCGPCFLMLTDDYEGVRTAGNDTDWITSGVWTCGTTLTPRSS